MSEATIIFKGVELVCTGFFSRAYPMSNDRLTPPEDASFEIDTITYNGAIVTDLVEALTDLEPISDLCIEKLQGW